MARLIVKVISLLFLASVFIGCSAQWHIKRAVLKDPSVLERREIRLDTVIITQPEIVRDTFVMLQHDTINDTIDGIRYQLIRQTDTFAIEIECPADTVKVEVVRNVPQVRYAPLTWWQRNGWKVILCTLIIVLIYNAQKNE